tara:strand:+ start:481 stop:1728 length:1248 start_codon:yes stop_codon:yes gene_type:complete
MRRVSLINRIKLFIKKIPYLFNFITKVLQIFAKLIDFLIIPVAIFYDFKGMNVFEAKTRSFGHHLFEPIAVAVLNGSKKKQDQKRLLLLANQEKAYVKYTNNLLRQKFKIIEKYSFLNIYYWLARSEYCGLSRSSKYKEELDIFYEAHFEFRKNLDILDFSELNSDKELLDLFKMLNPENRFIVIWKPKCHREDKFSSYSPLRYSSLDSCNLLFNKIYEEGGIVFGLLYGDVNFEHPGVIDLRKIKSNSLRERFTFYLDFNCRFGIVGQNGGSIPLHILKKPFMAYDVSYPYTLRFGGPKAIISLKEAAYKNGDPVRIETLVNLKFEEINKIISKKEMLFTPNSSKDIIDLYEELQVRMKINSLEFKENEYAMNVDWGENIPKNIYNRYGYSQVANCCYYKQYDSLAPKELLNQY